MLQSDPLPDRRPPPQHYGAAVDNPSTAHASPSPFPSSSPSSSARILHLDGLRAVALLGVLSFHFRLGPFTGGGFVGVDMFFTLSGYLITRNLLRDLTRPSSSSTQFSLRRFYERRFFRLFPAAVVTLLVTLLITASIFTKELSITVYTRAVATLLLLSNVFSHWHRGYFDISADDSPLLHYWSLSVEEQFYLLWPPFLLLLRASVRATLERQRRELENKNNGSTVAVIVEEEVSSLKSSKMPQGSSLDVQLRSAALQAIAMLSVLSFAFAATVYFHHPSSAFYELPSRVFQFGVGAMLSAATPAYDKLLSVFEGPSQSSSSASSPQPTEPLLPQSSTPIANTNTNNSNKILAEFVSMCAFIVVLASLVLIPSNPWPVFVLPMTLATGLLIIAQHTFVARVILSHPILLFIGRISYSVYLVHWPVNVLGTHFQCALGRVNAFNLPYARAFLFAASFPLGILLYHTVETKFRHIYGTSTSSSSVPVNASDYNMDQQKLLQQQQQQQQKRDEDACKTRRRRTVYALFLTSFVFAVTGVVTGGLPQLFPGQDLTGFPPELTGAAPARSLATMNKDSSTFMNSEPFTNSETFVNDGHAYHARALREQLNLHPEQEQQHPPQNVRALTTNGVCFSVTDKFKPRFTEVYVCRYGATHIPGKQPDMYGFGDSFASMLAVALHVIGQRHNMLFQVHFALNCGLRAKGYELVALGDATGYDCLSATGVLWSHMDMLPGNATILVSNMWHCYGNELVDELGKLRADIEGDHYHHSDRDSVNGVRMMSSPSSMALSPPAPYRTARRGRTMKVITEPPGIHGRYNWVYRCESLWGLPLGRALAWMTRTPFRGGAYCLSEADRVALPPTSDMLRKHLAIQTAKRTCLRNNTVVDLVSELCMGLDDADTAGVRCRLPIAQTKVMWDVGYKFDLFHMSTVGAFNVAGLLEQQLL